MLENQIDCIVRFHDFSRLHELNRCIFSLVGQAYRPLNIILVVQRFSVEQIAAVNANLKSMLGLPGAPSLQLENLESSTALDARTELLNLGLHAAKGQYVAFLDYDDVLYPEAYSILVKNIQSSDAAIAFASVRPLKVDMFPQFVRSAKLAVAPFKGEKLQDLFRANFCPIHSYLIDRSKVSSAILRFDTSLVWEEDYDLLLKICANYQSDFAALGITIGDYYFKTDGSNSIATEQSLSTQKNEEYKKVAALIEARRRVTYLSPAVQKQLGFIGVDPAMSIRNALGLIRK